MAELEPACDGLNHEDCCPICLRSTSGTGGNSESNDFEFVYSRSCGHVFCLACVQQLLLAPSLSTRTSNKLAYNVNDDEKSPIPPVVTPTHGVCPMCRADLSYFDLFACCHEGGSIVKTSNSIVPSDPLPEGLSNSVFAHGDKVKGPKFTISFPSNTEFANSDDVLIISISLGKEHGNSASAVHIPPTEYRFLSATNTLFFSGKGKPFPAFPCEPDCRVWLTFSDCFQFITHGVVRFTSRTKQCMCNKACADEHPGEVKAVMQYAIGGDDDVDDVPIRQCATDSTPNSGPGKAPSYSKSSLWGNVFCQHYTVGATSFHFLPLSSDDPENNLGEAYLSHEHVTVAQLLPLDNGRPVPARVKFRNITCPDPYTFRASICWMEDFNTTWGGSTRWDYEMKFDAAYMCILSGNAKSVAILDGVETSEDLFSFGPKMTYVNAGLFEPFQTVMAKAGRGRSARSNRRAAQESLLGHLRLQEDVPKEIVASICFLLAAASSKDHANPMDLRFFNR